MSSGSEKSPSRERSKSPVKAERHKMFITNLDGSAQRKELENELEQMFSKYGRIKELSVKRSKNGEYSFAFVEYQPGEDAEQAIANLNGTQIKGRPMKVQIQDDSKRRKDPDKGCYTCGKKGHFARECHSNKEGRDYIKQGQGYRRKSRSRSQSDDRGKRKKAHRSQSPSSQKEKRRSRNKKDKDRKHSSKDKKKKKQKKKHKSSSDSDS